MYKIEKGVPIPEKHIGASAKYPFATMAVGDSFVVPNDVKARSNAMRAMTLANISHKADGVRFTSRTQKDGTLRVWRSE